MFYSGLWNYPSPVISCGYHCQEYNRQKGRSSTNHMGKALDLDFALQPGEDKADDRQHCNMFRDKMVEFANCQVGW